MSSLSTTVTVFLGLDHFLWHISNFVDTPHTRTINQFVSANEDVVNIQCTSCAEQQPRWQVIYYVRRCSFTLSKPFGCSTCFDSVTNFFLCFSSNAIHKFQKQGFFVLFLHYCRNHLGAPPASTMPPIVCKVSFLGPREPLVLPLVDPPVRKKILDHLYTGICALWIIFCLFFPIVCKSDFTNKSFLDLLVYLSFFKPSGSRPSFFFCE